MKAPFAGFAATGPGPDPCWPNGEPGRYGVRRAKAAHLSARKGEPDELKGLVGAQTVEKRLERSVVHVGNGRHDLSGFDRHVVELAACGGVRGRRFEIRVVRWPRGARRPQ